LPEELCHRLGLVSGSKVVIEETPRGLLLRAADPPLTKVYVEPTNSCNLSCRTCVRNSWSEPTGFLSMDSYRKLIDGLRQVPSARRISFWGFGEPLLHPDIVEMVAMAKGLRVETQLITNGLLLDRETAHGLVNAGLDSLVVSIDGASEKVYSEVRPGANLEQVRDNIGLLREVRRSSPRRNPEIGIEFVAMRSNLAELGRVREVARSLGASFIVITNVLPYTEEMKDEVLYGLSAGRSVGTVRSKWWPEVSMPLIDIRGDTVGPIVDLLTHSSAPSSPQLRFDTMAGYCRFVSEGSAVVAWDGEVSPCVALMHSYPCYVMGRKKQIRRFSVGNVARARIAEIWGSDQFVRFRDLVQRFDFAPCSDCGGCHLAESNEEDCFGNGFPVCGDCLWAKGVIQCP